MARFMIVTDNDTYIEGEATAVPELGCSHTVLKEYKTDGDWVQLTYSSGLKISIPASHIRYIVETTA